METVKFICKIFWKEILCVLMGTTFLWKLHCLNNELLSIYTLEDSFGIIFHKNGTPLIYFFFALLFAISGIWILVTRFKQILHNDLDKYDFFYNMITIIVISIFLILLWILIQHPILRAIITALAAIGCFGVACSK